MYLFNYSWCFFFFPKRNLVTCSCRWDKLSVILFFFFLAVLGLHCCSWAFSSSVSGGSSLVEVRRLLIVEEQGGFSSCGSPT